MAANNSKKCIGTHDGTFHCDEALACFLLKKTDTFKHASVTRTRDAAVLETMDAVVDVGGTYEPEKLRFDHHQRGFEHTFDDKHATKLSSAGLIYKHFGREIIKSALQTGDDSTVTMLYEKLYDNFIEELDAVDNGVSRYPADVPAKYIVSTSLPQRVGSLNPYWNEDVDNKEMDVRFTKAMETAGSEFMEKLNYYIKAWLPAYTLVKEAVDKRFEVDASGQIVVLECGCPWKEHMLVIEKEAGVDASKPLLYVLYPDQSKSWRVQCVPVKSEGFQNRKSLPEKWQGVRDQALSDLTGVEGCIFIHANGFIGGCKTYEAALSLARMALIA